MAKEATNVDYSTRSNAVTRPWVVDQIWQFQPKRWLLLHYITTWYHCRLENLKKGTKGHIWITHSGKLWNISDPYYHNVSVKPTINSSSVEKYWISKQCAILTVYRNYKNVDCFFLLFFPPFSTAKHSKHIYKNKLKVWGNLWAETI